MSAVRLSHYPRRDGPMPEDARWVGRPTRWGNPWTVNTVNTVTQALDLYRQWLTARIIEDPDYLTPLRTYTALACVCPLDQPCHVDIILEHLAAGATP